jgi:glycerol-3-phosphate acyltransferase PlsY
VSIWAKFVLLLVFAYLLGSVPMAYLITRWKRGIDIRKVGTGNVGSSNVFSSTSSKWLTLSVAVFDIGKGALMVWIAGLLGLNILMQGLVGIAAIIGHNYPLFLNFHGGRGILTSLGVIAALAPWIGLIVLVFAMLMFALIKQMGPGVFIALLGLPFLSWFLGRPLGVQNIMSVTTIFAMISLFAFFRRLVVPRSVISLNLPLRRVFFYRLVFDRDISDRKAWIEQSAAQKSL